MNDGLKVLTKLVDDVWEMIFGTKRREEKDIGHYIGLSRSKKRKRARKKDGTFRGDDKSTPDVNEAWENE